MDLVGSAMNLKKLSWIFFLWRQNERQLKDDKMASYNKLNKTTNQIMKDNLLCGPLTPQFHLLFKPEAQFRLCVCRLVK